MPRERFYLPVLIWDFGLSAQELSVLVYLCYCANQDRECFPSISRISSKCSLSAATVRRSLHDLEEKKLIQIMPQFRETKNGKRRQTTNIYRLVFPLQNEEPTKEKATPWQTEQGVGLFEIEQNIKDHDLNQHSMISLSDCENELINNLELSCYDDQNFANAIEMIIRTMFCSDSICVSGKEIPQSIVREHLHRLDIDCIDHVYQQIENYETHYRNLPHFLQSCLFNAPIDCFSKKAAITAAETD